MDRKLNKKKLLLVCVFVILILILIILNIINHNKSQDDDLPQIEIVAGAITDEETPEEVIYINLSNEDKILSCFILGEFENGQNLSSDDYLKVAYNALNNEYVSSNKNIFSEEEINNIIYSIFNVQLAENKSIDGLTYNNGTYELEKSDSENLVLKNIENSVAAGSIYVEFEINNTKYIARLNTNTLTGENYIQSIMKN